MPKRPEPRAETPDSETPDSETPDSETPPDEGATPVPNRRERRGGKSATFSPGADKSAIGRHHGVAPNPRQYSTRRRGG